MAINFGNIVLAANRLAAPCAGGQFKIRVLVNGVENGTGGNYSVSIYQDDTFPNPDDLLDQLANVAIPAGVGRFRRIHSFTLSCDNNCDIAGRLGTSGDNPADVYAFVREIRVFGNRANSNSVTLTCVEDEECVVPEDGKPYDKYADRGKRLDIFAPAGAVAENTTVRIAYTVDEPDTQFFADNVDTDIRRVAIGDASLRFDKPVTVQWRLGKSESGIIKDLQGSIVRYDPLTSTWSSTPSRFTGSSVSFDIVTGGLYGLAGHARLSSTCYRSLKLPPDTE